ncbi:MAG: carboxypeptidase regulatory-like domain-containing protein [Deltaproteobacteria bacterium]|nr:carboxypeptidase regulatory-like domain-containing protein [Deltaproteobacteria bacterium]
MRRCIQEAIQLVGFMVVLALPVAGAAQDLVCTDCHNPSGIPAPHNSSCSDTSCTESCHAKSLAAIRHPAGSGTPLGSADRTTICETCHNKPFPDVYHPYQINVSAGTPTAAGLIDLDLACGQCHGGGTDSASNPPVPGAAYLTKAELGGYALNMHDDKPVAMFGYAFGNPDTLIVSVDATQSLCLNVCDEYDWDWGDASAHGTGVTASHAYAAGNYTITLTVRDTGMGSDTFSQAINVTAPDYPPTAAGDCAFDANTWTQTLTDASTDDHAVVKVTVNWGDGSVLAIDTAAPFGPFSRTYANVAPASPGYYTITHKAYDALGQQSTRTCTAAPAYFTLSGTVRSRLGANLPAATVTVRKGATVVKTVYTATNGTFSVASLKPATYTLTVTKNTYTFAVPAATITVGPSSSGTVINAIAP